VLGAADVLGAALDELGGALDELELGGVGREGADELGADWT
jgi:hypothetical protein